MKTSVISIINYKGGVGKTTVTFNVGCELARKDKKVLLIDFDGQGNLTKLANLKLPNKTIINPLDDVLMGRKITDLAIINVKENLDIVPCNIEKEGWQTKAITAISRETILKRYIDEIKTLKKYDYILIDNAPSVNLDFQNSLVASDEYIIVTEAAFSSADGVAVVYEVIKQVKEFFNKDLKAKGIIINKLEKVSNVHKEMKSLIESIWDDEIYVFKNYIPKSVTAIGSEFAHLDISEFNKKSNIAKAYAALTDEFINR